MGRIPRFILWGLALVGVDQGLKAWVVWFLTDRPGGLYPLWPGVLDLHLTHNQGVAFGLFQGEWMAVLFPAIALVALPFLWKWVFPKSRLVDAGMVLALAGGVSNLLDKLVRGYVVDFLEIRLFQFAVFNLADVFITGGIVLLVVALIRATGQKEGPDAAP